MTKRDLQIRDRNGEPFREYSANFSRFLKKGGAAIRSRTFYLSKDLSAFKLQPKPERREVLAASVEYFETLLVKGVPKASVVTKMDNMNRFMKFVDRKDLKLTKETLGSAYLAYAEDLFVKTQMKPRKLGPMTALGYGLELSEVFSDVLDLSGYEKLFYKTRLTRISQKAGKKAPKFEKQNLEETFRIGRLVTALSANLTPDVILGPMPVSFSVDLGGDWVEKEITLNPYRLGEGSWIYSQDVAPQRTHAQNMHLKLRGAISSLEESPYRRLLFMLRVISEFYIFLAQSGANLSVASELRRDKMKYRSYGDRWLVKAYKRRRGGEVEFEIFKEYRPYFKRYISFLERMLPDSDRLFPKLGRQAEEVDQPVSLALQLKRLTKQMGVPYVPPSSIRKTRTNWYLRRSGDETLTAEQNQHTKEVLREQYEAPSQQKAMGQITRFWNEFDPIKKGEVDKSASGGECNGIPEESDAKPPSVVSPNCINPTGCLWCKNLRDVDSFDFVWSLISFRYLKTLEAGSLLQKETTPADEAINRVTEKLYWFRSSGNEREEWVQEAELRIEEEHFHPDWSPVIEFLDCV